VIVVPSSSSRAEPRCEVVESVVWPFLVFLQGWPGAVHPVRCARASAEQEGLNDESTDEG
jgi:hypothetical protein